MKNYLLIGFIAFLIAFVVLGVFAANSIIQPYDGKVLVIEDTVYEDDDSFIIDGEQVLVNINIIKEKIDPYALWDENAQKVTVTTRDKTIRMATDSLTALINTKPVWLNLPVKIVDDVPFLPIDFLADFFGIKVNKFLEIDRVVIDFLEKERNTIQISEKTKLKTTPSIFYPNYKILNKGSIVHVVESEDSWYRVRDEKGVMGYIKKPQEVQVMSYKTPKEKPSRTEVWRPKVGKINLVWDYIHSTTPDKSGEEKIKGLDVLSPTWFHIVNKEGKVENRADINYVNWAHNQGYQVWALFSNSFDPDLTSHIVNNTNLRERVINQILVYSELYNLDGINIDFENVYLKDRDAFTQFVRELTPVLREQGLIVSIDVTVKSLSPNWSLFYDRKKLGEIVDYVALMAYDEHWAASPVSGPVASIGWVERGIRTLLEDVPKEKVLLGLPFYTRVWREEPIDNGQNVKVSSRSLSMAAAERRATENNAEIVWDDRAGAYYASYKTDGATYRIWLEEEKSIDLKVALVEKYDLAGAASWRKGLEKEIIWDVLYERLKKD